MLQKLQKRKEGFTIIEVLIVLAIAGLIMLVVFLAVPALQRNSRNSRLKSDVTKAGSVLQETINNNDGTPIYGATIPTILDTANAKYAQLTSVDYNANAASFQTFVINNNSRDKVFIRNWSVCTAGGNGKWGRATDPARSNLAGTVRSFTLTYIVESPGTTSVNGVPANYTAQCVES